MKASALPCILGLVLCATGTAAPRSQAESDLARQRFEATAKAVAKAFARRRDLSDEGKERLADLQFDYELQVLPRVRNEQRFGAARILVSDGWMALAEDLLRAAALDKRTCFEAFARAVLSSAKTNLQSADTVPEPVFAALPRLDDFVDDHNGRAGEPCSGIGLRTLRNAVVEDRARRGIDAMLQWLLARQIALHVQPRGLACPEREADERASTMARDAGQDLTAAAPAVLAHTLLLTIAEPGACIRADQRLGNFRGHWPSGPQWPWLDTVQMQLKS